MSDLKLIAFDADDLQIMSAHLQDAVLRVGDMAFLPREKRFALIANRFDWAETLEHAAGATKPAAGGQGDHQRRRTALRFERVLGAQVQGVDLADTRATLSLLAVSFTPSADTEAAGGDVTLTFSGSAAIRLTVECLEAQLSDLGAVWSAKGVPNHPDEKT